MNKMSLNVESIPTEGLPLVLKALNFAANKHRRQRRKDAGASPYINHPIELAEILCLAGGVHDPVIIAAAILHDTIEDTETTGAELEQNFGAAIRRIVEEVTDDKALPATERKQIQIARAATASEQAKLVKIADKICNVRDVVDSPPVGWSYERRRNYVIWAHAVVNEVRGTNATLERYFDELYLRALEQLGDDSCF
jgi:GTP diphosphokinase / guanosine-3',5'-bis(diphosphate) 3'-diphosphatase